MRRRRDGRGGRRIAAVLLAPLLVLVVVTGCAGGGSGATAAARVGPISFLDDALRLIRPGFSEGTLFARAAGRVEAPLGATSDDLSRVIARAPVVARPDEARALSVLRARLRATQLIQQGATVNRQVDEHATGIAAGSADDPSVRTALTTVTRDVVKDLACGQLFDQLAPEEKQDAADAGRPVWQDVGEASVKAVVDYAASRVGPAAAGVRWGLWWDGVADDAQQLVGAGQETVAYPTYVRSRAFYYYVKVCLQVPR